MITFQQMHLGQVDAKNEVFQQSKLGLDIFSSAFVVPPSVELKTLFSGGKFFVVGPKGSGKTSLLLYAKHMIEKEGSKTNIILFKSDLTEVERQRILLLTDVKFITDANKIEPMYDYKQNWLWYILKGLIQTIDDRDVISGLDVLDDLRKIVGKKTTQGGSIFSGLQLTKLKAIIETAFAVGGFKTKIGIEMEAIKSSIDKDNIFEIIHLIESHLPEVALRPGVRCCLFFDELELFVGKEDQRNRDLFLLRDLVYSIMRTNRTLSKKTDCFTVYGSIRTEVLSEINQVGPELKRDVDDFSVSISWDVELDPLAHPLLNIFKQKIQMSEIAAGETATEAIWQTYFPGRYKKIPFPKFLLDVSMLKPRVLVQLLSIIRENNLSNTNAKDCNLDLYMLKFSSSVWSELEEEILTSRNREFVQFLKGAITGMREFFYLRELKDSMDKRRSSNEIWRKFSRIEPREIIDILYRFGAIGNHRPAERSSAAGSKNSPQRDRWIFRGYEEPLYDEKFVFHRSVHKVLQIG